MKKLEDFEHTVVRTLLFLGFPAAKQLAMSNLSGCLQRRSENWESESALVEPGYPAGFLGSQVGGGSVAISMPPWWRGTTFWTCFFLSNCRLLLQSMFCWENKPILKYFWNLFVLILVVLKSKFETQAKKTIIVDLSPWIYYLFLMWPWKSCPIV